MGRTSKEETKRLLNHALESSTRLTAKKLAEELGEPESRISQGRRAEWTLTEEQVYQLIQTYGQPRSGPGKFVRAEVADSIKNFLENERALSRRRHLERILNHAWAPETREWLLNKIRPKASGLTRPQALEQFDKFVHSSHFEQWLEGATNYLSRAFETGLSAHDIHIYLGATTYYDLVRINEIPVPARDFDLPHENSLRRAAEEFGLEIDGMWSMDLLLLGKLYYGLADEQNRQDLGINCPFALNPKNNSYSATEIKEFVITGDLVWDEENKFREPKVGMAALDSLFIPLRQDSPQSAFYVSRAQLGHPPINENLWDIDYWITYRVMLFINKHCDYSMLIELGGNDTLHISARSVVIPRIPGLELFQHLNALRTWLELEELPEIEIKEQIAAHGGYIPGTTVL